jgi:hypothetical protein
MNKKLLFVSCFLLTALQIRSASLNLQVFEPNRAIQSGVKKFMVIQNTTVLNQAIDLSTLTINANGELVMRKHSILTVPDTTSIVIQPDPEQAWTLLEFFKASEDKIVFSYALKSAIRIGNPQYRYGVLKKVINGWEFESYGLFKDQVEEIITKFKN